MMTLQIFKNGYDYEKCIESGEAVEFYETTLNGYSYVMHGPEPFKFINGLGERLEINPMDIDRVIRSRDNITIILNVDSYTTATPWSEILINA